MNENVKMNGSLPLDKSEAKEVERENVKYTFENGVLFYQTPPDKKLSLHSPPG